MPTSNVNLTPELQSFVQEQVSSGHFDSQSEVHRAALVGMKHLEEERQARIQRLRHEVQLGIDELDSGLGEPIEDVDVFLNSCGEKAKQPTNS